MAAIQMIVLVTGVSGAGKTTIGGLVATALGGQYIEGDVFHPPANLAKMRLGLPLSDEDRLPWLQALGKALQVADRKGAPVVLGCSALRESYRQLIRAYCPQCQIVWLRGSPELVAARIEGRHGHFMPASLLSSQFAILEAPADAIDVDIDQTPGEIVKQILDQLASGKSSRLDSGYPQFVGADRGQ